MTRKQPAVIRVTTKEPKHLAWLALRHRLHAGGILKDALLDYLWDRKGHSVAMAFDGTTPVCIALISDWGQLMVYTRRQYRRQGIGRRAANLVARSIGIKLNMVIGSSGKQSNVSSKFFEALNVEFVP